MHTAFTCRRRGPVAARAAAIVPQAHDVVPGLVRRRAGASLHSTRAPTLASRSRTRTPTPETTDSHRPRHTPPHRPPPLHAEIVERTRPMRVAYTEARALVVVARAPSIVESPPSATQSTIASRPSRIPIDRRRSRCSCSRRRRRRRRRRSLSRLRPSSMGPGAASVAMRCRCAASVASVAEALVARCQAVPWCPSLAAAAQSASAPVACVGVRAAGACPEALVPVSGRLASVVLSVSLTVPTPCRRSSLARPAELDAEQIHQLLLGQIAIAAAGAGAALVAARTGRSHRARSPCRCRRPTRSTVIAFAEAAAPPHPRTTALEATPCANIEPTFPTDQRLRTTRGHRGSASKSRARASRG
jgi:hypothetical protein